MHRPLRTGFHDHEPALHEGQPGSNPGPEPDPDPDSPAPPIIILPRSSNVRAAPHIQVPPDPAGVGTQPPTPFSSAEGSTNSRYSLRRRENNRVVKNPEKPYPEPHPAPPVIILSTKRPASSSPPRSTPPSSTSPATTASLAAPFKQRIMGSKLSKVTKVAPSNGKLQTSQERQDKEQMKEPDNYYTHRSKSMRRKAGKTGAGSGAETGSGGGAGGVA